MSSAADRFLDVVPAGGDTFSSSTNVFGTPIVFGGQVFAQSLAAATRTVPSDLVPVTLSAHLIRGGSAGEDLHFEVEPIHDGRNSCVRRVTVSQHERGSLAICTVTFRAGTTGVDRYETTTRVLSPPACAGPSPFSDRWAMDQFEFAHVKPEHETGGLGQVHPVWVRPKDMRSAALNGAALVAFISDMGVVLQAAERGELRHAVVSTAEHSLWLHRAIEPRSWLLLDARLRSREGDLATVMVELRNSDGALVADAVQSVVVRAARTT